MRALIDPSHPEISLSRQCDLLGRGRSSYYYQPCPVDQKTLDLMRLIDEQYTRTPFYGVLRMVAWLGREGFQVNPKRVRRLMRLMGLEAIYPKPRLSDPDPEHVLYPYLLRDLIVDRPDQVWCSDITYIRLRQGFVYLVAVMDWHSRYVLSWSLSSSLEEEFCLDALDRALTISSGIPEIVNTDQGSQFTGKAWIGMVLGQGSRVSMDGRGRALDNVFIERLWRSMKYENIYLNEYESVQEVRAGIKQYLTFYNTERPHQALNYRTPLEVYSDRNRKDLQEVLLETKAVNETLTLP